MAIYVVETVEDAHYWAKQFGMKVERKRGRFPIGILRERLESYGHTLDDSSYTPSTQLPKRDPIYRVTAPVKVKNGRGRPKNNGADVRVARRVVELPLSEIRTLTGRTGPGRPGDEMALQAAIAREGWEITDKNMVEVQVIDKG